MQFLHGSAAAFSPGHPSGAAIAAVRHQTDFKELNRDIRLGGDGDGRYQTSRMSDIVPASMTPAELEKFLHAKIPLTAAMGIRVIQTGPHRLVLEAPLAPNINHLGTVFGGALHTLPTLACYAALWTLLVEGGLDGHVVVKESHARYRAPVRGTFRASCERPAPELAARFLDELRRFRKARMELKSVVDGTAGKPAVEFTGSFVAVV